MPSGLKVPAIVVADRSRPENAIFAPPQQLPLYKIVKSNCDPSLVPKMMALEQEFPEAHKYSPLTLPLLSEKVIAISALQWLFLLRPEESTLAVPLTWKTHSPLRARFSSFSMGGASGGVLSASLASPEVPPGAELMSISIGGGGGDKSGDPSPSSKVVPRKTGIKAATAAMTAAMPVRIPGRVCHQDLLLPGFLFMCDGLGLTCANNRDAAA